MPQNIYSVIVEDTYPGTIWFNPLFAQGVWGPYSGTQEWNVTANITILGGTMKVYGDGYNFSDYGMRNLTPEGHGQEWNSLTGNE